VVLFMEISLFLPSLRKKCFLWDKIATSKSEFGEEGFCTTEHLDADLY